MKCRARARKQGERTDRLDESSGKGAANAPAGGAPTKEQRRRERTLAQREERGPWPARVSYTPAQTWARRAAGRGVGRTAHSGASRSGGAARPLRQKTTSGNVRGMPHARCGSPSNEGWEGAPQAPPPGGESKSVARAVARAPGSSSFGDEKFERLSLSCRFLHGIF